MTEESKWLFGIGIFVTVCGIAMLLTDNDWSSHARAKASIVALHPARQACSPVPVADQHAQATHGRNRHRSEAGMEDCHNGGSDHGLETAEVELVSLPMSQKVTFEAENARLSWTQPPATTEPSSASRRQLAGNATANGMANGSNGHATRSMSVPSAFKSVKTSVRPQQVLLSAEKTRSAHARSTSSLPAHNGSNNASDRIASLALFEGFSVLSPRQHISPRLRSTSYSWSDVDDSATNVVEARTSPHEQ